MNQPKEIKLSGTHGTTSGNARSIRNAGFSESGGRLGSGVYIWKESPHAKNLAIAWVRQRFPGTDGVVLTCTITLADENSLFSADDRQVKDKIYLLAKHAKLDPTNDRDVCAAYDLFIARYEKRAECHVLVIEGETFPPQMKYFKKGEEYPVKVLGNPLCYAVRESGIIQVDNTSEVFSA